MKRYLDSWISKGRKQAEKTTIPLQMQATFYEKGNIVQRMEPRTQRAEKSPRESFPDSGTKP